MRFVWLPGLGNQCNMESVRTQSWCHTEAASECVPHVSQDVKHEKESALEVEHAFAYDDYNVKSHERRWC